MDFYCSTKFKMCLPCLFPKIWVTNPESPLTWRFSWDFFIVLHRIEPGWISSCDSQDHDNNNQDQFHFTHFAFLFSSSDGFECLITKWLLQAFIYFFSGSHTNMKEDEKQLIEDIKCLQSIFFSYLSRWSPKESLHAKTILRLVIFWNLTRPTDLRWCCI